MSYCLTLLLEMASTIDYCFKLTTFMFVVSIAILMQSLEYTYATETPITTVPEPTNTSMESNTTGYLTAEWYNSVECEISGCTYVKYEGKIVGIKCCMWYPQIRKWIRNSLSTFCQFPNEFNVDNKQCLPAPTQAPSPTTIEPTTRTT